jgi:hypothetical protein
MDRYRGKTSTFFSKLANGLGTKLRAAIVPLSGSLGPPGPQTCLSMSSRNGSTDRPSISSHLTFAVFEFPNELILSILSYGSPDLGRYARFYLIHNADIRYRYRQRVAFLLPLSMTCRAMRLRLLPWIWERIEMLPYRWTRMEHLTQRSKAIVGALRTDPYLGMSVKYILSLFVPGSRLICVL